MSKYRKFTELLDDYLKDEEFAAEFLSEALEKEDFFNISPFTKRRDSSTWQYYISSRKIKNKPLNNIQTIF